MAIKKIASDVEIDPVFLCGVGNGWWRGELEKIALHIDFVIFSTHPSYEMCACAGTGRFQEKERRIQMVQEELQTVPKNATTVV
ncbi:hypothetical protein TRIUR3_10837 [Triticum urartu]|uniref:Uncharacterized protein n=1 Tax=Triticum urartu TaxID=4572 RepID=M7ZXP7_TRIUA|nr:hypothetical protein TRIUR3_10837 [Triticum urartu]